MSDKCMVDPGRECQNSTRLALLEKRVGDLETGQNREESFRKDYYEEREARIARDTALDSKIDAISTKLDTVVEYQETQQAKPAKRWENLVDIVVGAVVGFLLAQIGL